MMLLANQIKFTHPITKKEINIDLLKTHLLLNIENVIENFSDYLELIPEGISKSFSDASSFLKVD